MVWWFPGSIRESHPRTRRAQEKLGSLLLVSMTSSREAWKTFSRALLRHGISLWIDVPLDFVAGDVQDKLGALYDKYKVGYATADAIISVQKGYNDEDEQPQGEGDSGNIELVGDVGESSNDLVVDAFDLDNLILVEPNDDAQSEEDHDDDGDGDKNDDIHGDDPIRGLNMFL
ncbi:hypothetical protein JHK87_039996 [Glycine soja]|nr:hypothetical protein JHK87_039996 [Glycine soja]